MNTSQAAAIDSRTAPYAALLLRVGLGAVFLGHALLKPLVLTFPVTAEFFSAHGFPGWTVYPVFVVELVGGAMLILGIYTRGAALALLPVTAGAFTVHWPNGWYFASPNGGWEYVAFLTIALLAQSALGNGRYALAPLPWRSKFLPGRDAAAGWGSSHS
jgi:putative oxidoreductase